MKPNPNANRNISVTAEGYYASPQISTIEEIAEENVVFETPRLLKNITEEVITATVLLVGNQEYIATTFYPGWNVELVKGVRGVVTQTLQSGY